jgi:hypothetical protein
MKVWLKNRRVRRYDRPKYEKRDSSKRKESFSGQRRQLHTCLSCFALSLPFFCEYPLIADFLFSSFYPIAVTLSRSIEQRIVDPIARAFVLSPFDR